MQDCGEPAAYTNGPQAQGWGHRERGAKPSRGTIVHAQAYRHTHTHACTYKACLWTPENPEETPKAWRDHANPTQREEAGINPLTLED